MERALMLARIEVSSSAVVELAAEFVVVAVVKVAEFAVAPMAAFVAASGCCWA